MSQSIGVSPCCSESACKSPKHRANDRVKTAEWVSGRTAAARGTSAPTGATRGSVVVVDGHRGLCGAAAAATVVETTVAAARGTAAATTVSAASATAAATAGARGQVDLVACTCMMDGAHVATARLHMQPFCSETVAIAASVGKKVASNCLACSAMCSGCSSLTGRNHVEVEDLHSRNISNLTRQRCKRYASQLHGMTISAALDMRQTTKIQHTLSNYHALRYFAHMHVACELARSHISPESWRPQE